jgi:hypothetical protein
VEAFVDNPLGCPDLLKLLRFFLPGNRLSGCSVFGFFNPSLVQGSGKTGWLDGWFSLRAFGPGFGILAFGWFSLRAFDPGFRILAFGWFFRAFVSPGIGF